MSKSIKIVKALSLIIILFELVLGAIFAIIYCNNLFDSQNALSPLNIVIVVTILLVFNSLYVWFVTKYISSLRQKSDLRAADIIGSDVQEAYNFAMIGLAITDEKNIVLWTNDLFKKRHIEIMDSDIIAWQPELAVLKDVVNGQQTTKITVNSRNYMVKLLQEAGLWIFKDITEYESIYNYSKDQALVIGILEIDNYEDVVRGDDDFNDIATKVKNNIFSYAKDFGILLRRIKDDSYSMLCNYASFSRMVEDRFSIIDKVRNETSTGSIPLTLSIGLAHDFPDVVKLNEMANEALDIAMSRGGDQVVVSSYGQEMKFYGGKSEAQEKRNRVKTRVLADSLISLISASERVLIMGHANMDMDAFGACLGIKAICMRLKKFSRLVVDIRNTEIKTRVAINSSFSKEEIDKLIINSRAAEDLISGNTLLIVLDVHIPHMVMAPRLLDKASKIIVIDHHRRAEEYIDSPVFNHIDSAASSTSELIAEFIKFSSINPRIELPSIYATIMLSGIFLDSSYFKSRKTGVRTFEAATILKEYGADNSLADEFLKDDYEEYQEVTQIITNIEYLSYGVVLATANPDRLYDVATIAKAANICLTFKGIRAALVFGKVSSRETHLSARSDGSINVSLITEKLGGGGHFTSAAASFNSTDFKEIKQSIQSVLDTTLEEASNQDVNKNSEEE